MVCRDLNGWQKVVGEVALRELDFSQSRKANFGQESSTQKRTGMAGAKIVKGRSTRAGATNILRQTYRPEQAQTKKPRRNRRGFSSIERANRWSAYQPIEGTQVDFGA